MSRMRNRLLGFIGLALFLHLSIVAFRRILEYRTPPFGHHGSLHSELADEEFLSGVEHIQDDASAPPPPPPPGPPSVPQGLDQLEQEDKEPEQWCQYNDCLKGEWVPREPRFRTVEEMAVEYGSFGGCAQDPPAGTTRTAEETEKVGRERLVNMINWVWKPDQGEVIPWDPEDLVVRLLKMPAGIIFIGDSVSAGHDHAFGNHLFAAGINFDMQQAYVRGNETAQIRPHVLRRDDPMTLKLQKRAGVPDSRLDWPVFNIIEEHMLIHEPDIRRITEDNGAEKGFQWRMDMKRIEGWETYLANVTRPRAGEESSVTEDTVIVLNTGAHWSRGTLYMLPDRDTVAEEHTTLAAVYKAMTQVVVDRFAPLERVKIVYRATTPAHPGCTVKTRPYANFQHAREHEWDVEAQITKLANDALDRRIRLRWDWDRFNAHNDVWRGEIAKMTEEREALEPGAKLPPKWLFMDVWDMALQRPDAHSDCLHWCLPTVNAEWTRHLYHLLHLEDQISL